MRNLAAITILLLSLSYVFAIEPVRITSPVQQTIFYGEDVDAGLIGPGQTFTIEIDPKVSKGGINNLGGMWDQAIATSLPDGWKSRPSKLYQRPLQVEITAPTNAPDGEYEIQITLEDEGNAEKIGGKFIFNVLVSVDKNVISMQVSPDNAEVGAGQPASFSITLRNHGNANDVVVISSSGVHGWAFRKSVYLSAGSTKTITYEVVGEEESFYKVTITAKSASSPLIHVEKPVTLSVRTNLLSDYKATSNGVLLFPFPQIPMYAIAGLLSLIFG